MVVNYWWIFTFMASICMVDAVPRISRWNKPRELLAICMTHSLIWAIMAAAIYFVLIEALFQTSDQLAVDWKPYVAMSLLFGEVLTLCWFRWSCPLTLLANRFVPEEDKKLGNYDIFLPAIVGKYNRELFTPPMIFGFALVLYRNHHHHLQNVDHPA